MGNYIKFNRAFLERLSCSKRFTWDPRQAIPTTAPFSTPWGAHYIHGTNLNFLGSITEELQSGTRFTHEWGEEMHVKSLPPGLIVDLAQTGLKPGMFWLRSQVFIRPQRH